MDQEGYREDAPLMPKDQEQDTSCSQDCWIVYFRRPFCCDQRDQGSRDCCMTTLMWTILLLLVAIIAIICIGGRTFLKVLDNDY